MDSHAPQHGFPATRHSVVAGLRDESEEARRAALDAFARDYWTPLRAYLRRRHRRTKEETEDLLQGFFVHLQERDVLAGYDPERARFRGFVRVLLDRWVTSAHRRGQTLKRGGGAQHESLDDAEFEPVAPNEDPDRLFREEWIRQLFSLALADLESDARAHDRMTQWEAFHRYEVMPETEGERPTYAELAQTLGIASTKVTNDLHAARRRFRALLLARLAEVCRDETEWREEAHDLLGITLP